MGLGHEQSDSKPAQRDRTSAPAIDIFISSGILSPAFSPSQKTASLPPPGISISADADETDVMAILSPRSERTQSPIWSPVIPTQSFMLCVSSLSSLSRVASSLHSSRPTARTYNTGTQTFAFSGRRGSSHASVSNYPYPLSLRFPNRSSSGTAKRSSVPASIRYDDNFISFGSIASAARDSAWANSSGPNLCVDANAPLAPPVPEVPELGKLPRKHDFWEREESKIYGSRSGADLIKFGVG
jgi:hypothetical protein